MISAAQAKRDRAKLRRELAAELRRKDREKLRELRAAIKSRRQAKRAAMVEAVELCRAERLSVRQSAKARRAAELARLKAAHERDKLKARQACTARKCQVRRTGMKAESAAREILAAERAYQASMRRAEDRSVAKQRAHRSSSHERRRESDDEVRSNLPDELVPVFGRVRSSIKGNDRLSRTEAFLKWAEEHPGEVVALQSSAAERDVAKLVREYEHHAKSIRKAGRYRGTPEELARALAAIPF